MDRSDVLPSTQFANQKRMGTCDVLLCLSLTRQNARGLSCRFISALPLIGSTIMEFSKSSIQCSIGGSVLSILTQFLSN